MNEPVIVRNVRVLPRVQDFHPSTPRVDGVRLQIWRDVNRNQLLARFASARNKGYVTQVTPIKRTARGEFTMVVKVLRDAPSRVPWYVAAVITSMSASLTIGLAAWHARYILLTMAGAILAVPLLYWVLTHFRVCPGLHCPCCKNG